MRLQNCKLLFSLNFQNDNVFKSKEFPQLKRVHICKSFAVKLTVFWKIEKFDAYHMWFTVTLVRTNIEVHCIKSVRIRSYSHPNFPVFKLNSVWVRENTDQDNSEYRHFPPSGWSHNHQVYSVTTRHLSVSMRKWVGLSIPYIKDRIYEHKLWLTHFQPMFHF